MIIADKSLYPCLSRFADQSRGESEYYHGILDGRQKGRAFVDDDKNPKTVLFRHYSGYGFLAGERTKEAVFETLMFVKREHPLFVSESELQNRFILMQDMPEFDGVSGLTKSFRLCFEYDGSGAKTPSVPDGFTVKTVDKEILSRMQGDTTPAFSWSSDGEFLKSGVAVCVLKGETPAAWAFSGALGGGRMDIGVETVEEYRGRGLARAAAFSLAGIAKSMGYMPVWGCDISNKASEKTALSAGFVYVGRHEKHKIAL